MERKNYLTEELSKEEKAYLKRIIMTAKNKYFEKNNDYINNTTMLIDKNIPASEYSILDTILERCQQEVDSAIEFEKTLLNPKLYNIMKALSSCEREVLFNLYWKERNIKETAERMQLDRKTVRKYRNRAQAIITEKLLNGGNKDVQ